MIDPARTDPAASYLRPLPPATGTPAGRAAPPVLPRPLTALLGREAELAELTALLRAPTTRLVTLVGPGGIGKTRLALAVAEALGDAFPDGVHFVDLAPLEDPELVALTIAGALDLPETTDRAALDRLIRALRDDRRLLVLDNWERLVAAAPQLATLLSACRTVTVLATSRTALEIRGEQQYPLAPLAGPRRRPDGSLRLPPLAELAALPAVALFVERAEAVDPTFVLDAANAAAVAGICARLEGLPLAIELATAWCTLLPPAAILARLERPLVLLTEGSRDLPDRQQTLRATIAWSYDLLGARERHLLRRLAVFAGGFTFEAATAICAGEEVSDEEAPGEPDILDSLGLLAAHSLIRVIETPSDEPRFAPLETIREFAADALAASGEADAVRDRHAAYYLALAEGIAPHLATTADDQLRWYWRMDVELPNLRAAHARFRERDDVARMLRLAVALGHYLTAVEHRREGLGWLGTLLAMPGVETFPTLHVQVLQAAAELAIWQEESRLAWDYLTRALPLYRALGDRKGEANALSSLGLVAFTRRDVEGAVAPMEEALAIAQELGETLDAAATTQRLGAIAFARGDFAGALARFTSARATWRAMGDPVYSATALANQGIALLALEQTAEAAVIFRRVLDEASAGIHELALSLAVPGLAIVALRCGAVARAARLFGAAAALEAEWGNQLLWTVNDFFATQRAAAKAALAAAEWAAADTAGRALSQEEALAEAAAIADEVAGGRLTPGAGPPPAASRAPTATGIALSARERHVLRLLVEGMSDAEIATELKIARRTASNHVSAILAKLGAPSRTIAAMQAVRDGLI